MVSILVPCFNHEKYIEDCIKSLIAQDYRDIELIIYDDCSTDSSFEIIKDWEERLIERFSNVLIHKNNLNLGVVKNLNAMIDASNGEYIKIIASDDMLTSNSISNLVDAAKSIDADIIFSNVAFIPETIRINEINISKLKLRYYAKPKDGFNLTGDLCGNNYISAPGTFIPKKTFEKYGKFDEEYCLEDFEFYLRVSTTGCIRYIESVTALYRQNNNSLSKFDLSKVGIKRHQKFCRDKIKIFSKYEKYASKEQTELFFNSELDSSIGINDKEMIKEIISIMKNKGLSITAYNYFRIPVVNIGVYPIIKKVKHYFKR